MSNFVVYICDIFPSNCSPELLILQETPMTPSLKEPTATFKEEKTDLELTLICCNFIDHSSERFRIVGFELLLVCSIVAIFMFSSLGTRCMGTND
jgi:hypothetical protein